MRCCAPFSHVRLRANRTLNRHRRMTESDPNPTWAGSKSRSAAVLRCAILSVGSTGGAGSELASIENDETTRIYHAHRQRCGVAARRARAAEAGYRVPQQFFALIAPPPLT